MFKKFSLLIALGLISATAHASTIVIDGTVDPGEWTGNEMTIVPSAYTPAGEYLVNAYANTNFFYASFEVVDSTSGSTIALNIGLKNGTPNAATSHNGAWSFAVEEFADFTDEGSVKFKFNDNIESLQTRDLYVGDLPVGSYFSARSGAPGGSQTIEFVIPMSLLATAFSATYSDFAGIVEGLELGLTGFYLEDYSAQGWTPSYFGDGSFSNAADYASVFVAGAGGSEDPLPEPSMLALLGLGLAGLGAARGRKKKQA